jgi:NTP pyrophosphatase (non-canonical NTP hydrolase)
MSKYNVHIERWFDERKITENSSPLTQAVKSLEELTELFDALNRDDKHDVMDAIGDIYVTLIGVCRIYGVDMEECIGQAYEEIKDRKGYLTPEGMFVKENK